MFSFRRKPKKPEEPPPIRSSPSLPDLKNSQGVIPWPEDLVDMAAIRQQEEDEDDDVTSVVAATGENESLAAGGGQGRPSGVSARPKGAVRISFTAAKDGGEPVKFHKPFYHYPDYSSTTGVPTPAFASSSAGEAAARMKAEGTKAPISQFYMALATPPEALDEMRKKKYERRMKSGNAGTGRAGQRRVRVPPTFNIMVVGSKGTGKSSLLRLLLETAEISPSATEDQRGALAKFLKDSAKATNAIQAVCVEICESKFDRILLSVIDTPGLDFQEGRELKLERQVNAVLKYVDVQYADTMNEESKVVRQQKGDQHIHLCIYMIDPASIMTAEARRALSSVPNAPTKTRSDTTVSQSHPPELVPDTSSADEDDEDDETEGPLTMSPAEIKVIRRISTRSNVLPILAHADSLTDEKLRAVKEAVRKGLADAGIDFGVFGPITKTSAGSKRATNFTNGIGKDSTNGHAENGDNAPATATDDEHDQEEEEEEERRSRPVIKLRPSRHRPLSRSRSRRDLSRVAEDERRPMTPDATDLESVANVRFSAHIIAKNDISALLPFALITPENKRRRRQKPTSILDTPATPMANSAIVAIAQQASIPSEGGPEGPSVTETLSPTTPASVHSTAPSLKQNAYLQGPPEDLKGVFTRKFRWGTVDVLDPNHCDFAALRTAILSTHLKVLKVHTREVLYEKYRTEKLLARRATQQISEEERIRLLEDLGL